MPGVRSLRKLQIGAESTGAKGTAVAATTIWRGTGTIQDAREVNFPPEDIGYLSGIDRTNISKYLATLPMEDTPATFEQLPYIFEAGISTAAPTTDAGSGYIYTYTFPTTAQNTIRTYTIEGGDDQQEEEMEYSFVKNFRLSGNAGEALMMAADWVGRQVTNASYTGALSVPSVEDILFSKGKFYIDPTSDTIGTTQLTQTWLGLDLNVNTGQIEVPTADGNLYFTFNKNVMPEITARLTFEHNSSAVTEKTNWRNETARQLRLLFSGSALTTTGTYDVKTLIIDLAGKFESVEKLGERDGNDIMELLFRARYNSTAALFAKCIVVNQLSALP